MTTIRTWPAPAAATPAERLAQVDRITIDLRRAAAPEQQWAADLHQPRKPRRARRWWQR